MEYPREWEPIDPNGVSKRLKIYGGWIVRTTSCLMSATSVHTLFIPDSIHQWELEAQKPCPKSL